MKKKTYDIGLKGEESAANYLKESGYTILKNRYKTPHGEIDIIAQHENLLVFAEVKARNNPLHMDLLTENQMKRSCNAGMFFLSENPGFSNMDVRFDFISIINGKISEHIENAWLCEFD